MSRPASIQATGESAVRVTGTTGSAERDWRLVHKLSRELLTGETVGIVCTIPTYESVLVDFDVRHASHTAVIEAITALLPDIDLDSPLRSNPRHFRVPVLYGGKGGPDLGIVAGLTGLSESEVVAAHSAPRYTVRCLGAPGGSPMLDGPDLGTPVPRLATPRTSVPQGAISLAGRQATLTPAPAPGGWQVIGRTPLTVLDLDAEPLVPYVPGDTLAFEVIGHEEFVALQGTPLRAEDPT